ncbi:MAG: hypothetical protein A3F53_01335 [Candidatus Zambryskibacteria bacterium RIFCSPHIGHO2_12_FULL_48_10]|nr:MAG: hypothetical protein A3F53_01335 [Candidatus Zambryskibacteria bacterium RIFCSPHIGHO2_12_FULL_48_10]OHB07006.1 MAG: hypothetical protein A3A31_01820 [Candidatus Zambryskibacteria bacterium RIFCSPLOWO2_01_FULL_48_25]
MQRKMLAFDVLRSESLPTFRISAEIQLYNLISIFPRASLHKIGRQTERTNLGTSLVSHWFKFVIIFIVNHFCIIRAMENTQDFIPYFRYILLHFFA